MEMTIAEAIEIISNIDKAYRTFSNIEYLSLSTAIATMRKYQKIVQIMERTVDDGTSMYDTLQEIEEVIADRSEEA